MSQGFDRELRFLDDLALDGEVSRGPSDRGTHAGSYDTAPADEVHPDAVVFAGSTADVSAVLAAADERGVPVTPYAAGTSLESHATPVEGGVSLDLTRMDRVLEVRPDDLTVDVEPGVIGGDLNERVARHGLTFPPLPSSGAISTVGGMIATDASGMGTVKYGEVGDWVRALEVVLADGTVIGTGTGAAKSSSGYNLTDLLVGSEGTLGVVTRATLGLAGIPEQIRGGRAVFPTLADATAAVRDAVTSGVDVAKIELMDSDAAALANDYSGTDMPERPMAFVEFHADHGVDEEVAFCEAVFSAHDVESFEVDDGDGMADLWTARRDITYAADEWREGASMGHPGDVTVPIGNYPEMIRAVKEAAADHDLFVPAFGHAGDGNLHYFAVYDHDDPDESARAERVYDDLVERALELDGTVTGEHGIGRGKRAYLRREHGDAVDAMRAIKDALDPNGTLNPGKVFPDE
ncbi:FAD-binding oxidoreductase [Halorarum salinum]|uniref:D-lactate dehydrogenase (cytochrome) n=1 Tax=Halorarum salinum TaxID=2743089 RepID=A0A7D5L9W0_9EURY|nr:FAD-binding oxidoreductase [Halobaculum salinum]QLG61387.1 FAD-binding oxidoreductase [Halobaculum salinum]